MSSLNGYEVNLTNQIAFLDNNALTQWTMPLHRRMPATWLRLWTFDCLVWFIVGDFRLFYGRLWHLVCWASLNRLMQHCMVIGLQRSLPSLVHHYSLWSLLDLTNICAICTVEEYSAEVTVIYYFSIVDCDGGKKIISNMYLCLINKLSKWWACDAALYQINCFC